MNMSQITMEDSQSVTRQPTRWPLEQLMLPNIHERFTRWALIKLFVIMWNHMLSYIAKTVPVETPTSYQTMEALQYKKDRIHSAGTRSHSSDRCASTPLSIQSTVTAVAISTRRHLIHLGHQCVTNPSLEISMQLLIGSNSTTSSEQVTA